MRIQIDGNPIPASRPRVTRNGTYNPRQREKTRLKTYLLSLNLLCLQGPLKVVLEFNMAFPKSSNKKTRHLLSEGKISHIKTPDIDNLIKFILDCANGILFDDDKQVVDLWASKKYSNHPSTILKLIPEKEEED